MDMIKIRMLNEIRVPKPNASLKYVRFWPPICGEFLILVPINFLNSVKKIQNRLLPLVWKHYPEFNLQYPDMGSLELDFYDTLPNFFSFTFKFKTKEDLEWENRKKELLRILKQK